MASRQDNLREDVRFRILRLIEANPEITQRDLSREVGVSLGMINFCLQALAAKGQVKINNFRNANNKLKYTYILTPKGVAAKASLTGRFLRRKVAEYETLRQEIEELQKELIDQDPQDRSAL